MKNRVSPSPEALITTSRWRFFPIGYEVTKTLKAQLNVGAMPRVADALVRLVLPPEALARHPITDISGADSIEPAPSTLNPKHRPSIGELLYVEGTYLLTDDSKTGHTVEPFNLAVTTKFKEFQGSHHIAFDSEITERGGLSTVISTEKLARGIGRIFPIELSYIRLEMSQFESRRTPLIGFTPSPLQHLLVEVTPKEIQINILLEGRRSRDPVTFSNEQWRNMLEFLKELGEVTKND